MNSQMIACTQCGAEIELTEAFQKQFEDRLRKEYSQQLSLEKSKLEQSLKQELEDQFSFELQDLRSQLDQKRDTIKDLQAKELGFRQRQRELDAKAQQLEAEVQTRVEQEKVLIADQSRQQTEQRMGLELQDLRNQIALQETHLEEARHQELELRRQKHELAQREKSLSLEVQRQLDAESDKIRQEIQTRMGEEFRLREAEKDTKIAGMLRQIEELKRKAEQGSQQAQGEALEIVLEKLLREQFPSDDIQPVPKGIRGTDVIQKVITQRGNYCGTILWESKRVKSWSDEWITKLKADQREVKADIAVIITTVLPKGIQHIGCIDGVWVADFSSLLGLTLILRKGLYDVAYAKHALAGKTEKMDLLYKYLIGPEFRQLVEVLVSTSQTMQRDLESEKLAMTRIWARREKQIAQAVLNTARMYGDLQGIIGTSLQPISTLELPAETAIGDLGKIAPGTTWEGPIDTNSITN
ncbi:MAG: DUF2130 domain-containing protein [Blastocatellia bacterium]|nr:DUF2130 domain-containing protein [Blastocatellia bacterium]